jgi:two-component system alkaline phosphatase synthesis response regulator PhoP
MKVLLVDDDNAIIETFGWILTKAQFAVVIATTGKEALEKAIHEKPDIILLDQILPDMAGNGILKRLKSQEQTKAIPVAILSNYSEQKTMEEALNLGADEYILKYQIEPLDLIGRISQIMREKAGVA